ncbi:ABC transporter permease [Caproiciproducens sp. LBM24188]
MAAFPKTRTSAQKQESIFERILNYKQFGLIVALILLGLLAKFITPAMYQPASLVAMLRNNSIYAILAIGEMVVILTGGIDISIASTLSLSGVISTTLMTKNPSVPAIVWVIVSLAIGALCGLFNGFLIGKLKMTPMIATLATMYIYRGLAFLISGGVWLFPNKFTEDFTVMSQGSILGIYNITWITIILFLVAGVFLSYTQPGRRIYAVGTNVESAHVSGIKIGNVTVMSYVLCGALSGLAGVLYTANYSICYYGIADGFEMQAIAICVLGGVSLIGGTGRIDGVVIGAVLMSVISYFIGLLPGLSVWQDAIQGAIIIVAVAINIFTERMTIKRILKERGAMI